MNVSKLNNEFEYITVTQCWEEYSILNILFTQKYAINGPLISKIKVQRTDSFHINHEWQQGFVFIHIYKDTVTE